MTDRALKINEHAKRNKGLGNEKVKRSILKTISWRIVGTVATILISWLITGTLVLAFSIGIIELFSKLVLYYYHERIWNRINWGK